jgi:hypothetical protein
MDSMHKHLANKCPVRFPNKKAEVAISSGVVTDFEILTAAGAEAPKDDDSTSDDDKDNGTSHDSEEEEGAFGLTKHGTVCKSCVKAQGRCRLHPLK